MGGFLSTNYTWSVFEKKYMLAVFTSILDFRSRALPNVPTNIDDIDGVAHINLTLVHVVEHFLGPFSPNFIIARMAEKAHTDDNVAIQGKALLRLEKLVLETGAATEGYYWVFADHWLIDYKDESWFNYICNQTNFVTLSTNS